MFCMLLRKHLTSGRILEVTQPPLERVVEFRLEALDELGDRVERRLMLEVISHRANLVLLDGEGRILDCIRRVDSGLSDGTGSGRLLQPGMFYRLPPPRARRIRYMRTGSGWRNCCPPPQRRPRPTNGC